MKTIDKIDVHEDLSDILKASLDIHFHKITSVIKLFLNRNQSYNLDELLEKHSAKNCEMEQIFNSVLKSKIKIIDDKKEYLLELMELHTSLHELQEVLITQYIHESSVDDFVYESFARKEFNFVKNLTALIVECESYEKNFDGLTNIFNRKYFFEKIEYDYKKSLRTHTEFSIVMGDIDYFKNINDSFGHQCGDSVLQKLSALMSEHIRAYDVIGRYGGEEFIFFIYADKHETQEMIERMRSLIKDQHFEYNSQEIKLTMSFGIAEYKDNLTISELVSQADQALYEAKSLGRDQAVIYKTQEIF